jgi:hypothetical protein
MVKLNMASTGESVGKKSAATTKSKQETAEVRPRRDARILPSAFPVVYSSFILMRTCRHALLIWCVKKTVGAVKLQAKSQSHAR